MSIHDLRGPTQSPAPVAHPAARPVVWAAVLSLIAAVPCLGGTIRHDRLDSSYTALAAQPQFQAVGRYFSNTAFCSFTLIAPNWALTAAHCVDTDLDGSLADETPSLHSVNVGGQSRDVAEFFVPTDWNGNINDGYDLALARLESPITTVTPATVYTGFQELGATITSVGFGRTGTGKTGASSFSGTKRAGNNVIDQFVAFGNGAAGLRFDFDEPAPRTSPNDSGSTTPLNLEYNIAPGDSGGGSFLFDNGEWFLAAVHSGVYNLFNYPGAASDTATYGDATLLTRVSAYQSFIFATIPEPASLTLLVFAGTLTLARRRTRS